MITITADQGYAALPVLDCINVIERAMIAVSRGAADLPLRTIMPLPGGNAMGMMPGALHDPAVHGMKLVSLFPGNPGRGLSSHQGLLILFDTTNGRPIAVLDGAGITAQRTAAARPDARVLTILGAGEQADHHLPALLEVRNFQSVRVWTRRHDNAEAFVERHAATVTRAGGSINSVASAEEAVRGADVIVTVTAAATPVLYGAWLRPGQHINLVGASVAAAREIDDHGLSLGRFFVDTVAGAKAQAGEYIEACKARVIGEDHLLGEIGSVYSGDLPGRISPEDITIYKSLGVAAQDIAAGHAILTRFVGEAAKRP
jgi:alanine dehydrogenase